MINKIKKLFGICDHEYKKTNICIINARLECVKCRKAVVVNLITSKKKYNDVLKSLLHGCKLLEKNKCKFIVIPCNTAHYWFDDLQKKINIPIVNMPKEVFKFTKKNCKKNSKVGVAR